MLLEGEDMVVAEAAGVVAAAAAKSWMETALAAGSAKATAAPVVGEMVAAIRMMAAASGEAGAAERAVDPSSGA